MPDLKHWSGVDRLRADRPTLARRWADWVAKRTGPSPLLPRVMVRVKALVSVRACTFDRTGKHGSCCARTACLLMCCRVHECEMDRVDAPVQCRAESPRLPSRFQIAGQVAWGTRVASRRRRVFGPLACSACEKVVCGSGCEQAPTLLRCRGGRRGGLYGGNKHAGSC